MHKIEPYYNWRDDYKAEEDQHSPFYRREYSEFQFSKKIYNYFIHPQWDDFESETLCLKILFADYDNEFAIIEFIGEWNDCISCDILSLKSNVLNALMQKGICKFILIGENILNFYAGDSCYYEEWFEEVQDEAGWIVAINFRTHVIEEMKSIFLDEYIFMSEQMNLLDWRTFKPKNLFLTIENYLYGGQIKGFLN
mgnify:CR=1 FL=1